MNSILFVDDDPGVLGGLRDSLRKHRNRWNMHFAASGEAALKELAAQPFDVVISDMRMPQMDGTMLLSKVKSDYPATARIILSGHADKDAIMRSLPVAHQFLTKPCDPAQLELVIERTCGISALLRNESIRQLVGSIDKLPSLPRSYLALTQLVAKPDVKIDEVIKVVEQDPAMCVKILQVVNSAYFGLPRQMTSIRQAVTYLGMDLLGALALSTHVFGVLEASALSRYGLERLQESSMLTARMARRFLRETPRADEAFTAGLVCDVGRIVMAVCMKERYLDIVERMRQTGSPCHVVEQELLHVTHAEIGAYLLGIWGLPLTVVEAVANHHAPERVTHADTDVVGAVHIADVLAQHLLGAVDTVGAEATLDRRFVERADVAVKLARWRQIAQEEFAPRPS